MYPWERAWEHPDKATTITSCRVILLFPFADSYSFSCLDSPQKESQNFGKSPEALGFPYEILSLPGSQGFNLA